MQDEEEVSVKNHPISAVLNPIISHQPRDKTEIWLEEEDLPFKTRCKIQGIKMMARWLLGLKDDKEDDVNNSVSTSAKKTFRMLTAIIDNKGDLLDNNKPRQDKNFNKKTGQVFGNSVLFQSGGKSLASICRRKRYAQNMRTSWCRGQI